ncbi:N-acetylmuramoyl-L-alanine amidase [Marmoricola sp. OAE513]|uniref:N-acetylmuramoyl-L-alanine amidase n=1 Tax=Marmoricola sp. OAE513 TaxID=2817894 RepID=UPI001D605507
MIRSVLAATAVVAVGLTAVLTSGSAPGAERVHDDRPDRVAVVAGQTVVAPETLVARTTARPLAGIRIALDPGHQLGNHRFPAKINRLVPAGGFEKPCNTTGTSTNGGYPEATANFAIASAVKKRLEALGATVLMTRTRNSPKLWGPCVDVRGRFGEKVHASLTVSLHADGTRASGRGFHVIAPKSRKPWTNDIAKRSLRLAKALRAGLDQHGVKRSNYLAGGTGLVIRSDLGTLNKSDVPIAMVELGNMRNAREAKRFSSGKGQQTYAAAVVAGIRKYLRR